MFQLSNVFRQLTPSILADSGLQPVSLTDFDASSTLPERIRSRSSGGVGDLCG